MKSLYIKRIALPYFILILIIVFTIAVVTSFFLKPSQFGSSGNRILFYILLGALSVIAIISGFLITWHLSKQIFDPIRQLTETARKIGAGSYDACDKTYATEEFQELSQALRLTAAQIGAQINALTNERAKFSAVLAAMTDGVLISDSDGHVELLNPAAERLFHIKESEALGRSVVEVMRHHQLVDLWSKIRQSEPKTIALEMGTNHTFLQVIGISLSPGLPDRLMLLFQDLTQIHRLETIRRDFISNVSHELRTPMASLKALSETLLDGALDDPPAARNFVLRMDTEVDNLTQLVNELLELSRIEGGSSSFEFQRIKPCQLLKGPFDRMAVQAERVGLSLKLECNDDLPYVFADRDRIAQVVINLLHNAIKFTPSGGSISAGAWLDGSKVRFWVHDTGVGIAKKDLTRIFERFYKADRARSGGGTGLGLSIAKHMVEAHGGEIWAESEEGSFSTFFFTIPIA